MTLYLWKCLDFSVTQFLREINLGESKGFKTAGFFAIIGALNFVDLGFSLQRAKIHTNQDSESRNVLKWQVLHF